MPFSFHRQVLFYPMAWRGWGVCAPGYMCGGTRYIRNAIQSCNVGWDSKQEARGRFWFQISTWLHALTLNQYLINIDFLINMAKNWTGMDSICLIENGVTCWRHSRGNNHTKSPINFNEFENNAVVHVTMVWSNVPLTLHRPTLISSSPQLLLLAAYLYKSTLLYMWDHSSSLIAKSSQRRASTFFKCCCWTG